MAGYKKEYIASLKKMSNDQLIQEAFLMCSEDANYGESEPSYVFCFRECRKELSLRLMESGFLSKKIKS